jgi:hypothetical protein
VHFANKTTFSEMESPAIEKAISSYVPEVVLKRLQAGQNEWIGISFSTNVPKILGELRIVTILFVSIHRDCMKLLDILNHSVMTIQSSIYRYEGQINKILYDDKGIKIQCLFLIL